MGRQPATAGGVGLHHDRVLAPVFIHWLGQHLRTHKVPLPAYEAELNVHLQTLRSLKESSLKYS